MLLFKMFNHVIRTYGSIINVIPRKVFENNHKYIIF